MLGNYILLANAIVKIFASIVTNNLKTERNQMTNKDIMVDIETLGTGNHALILSIGAVPFHLSSGFIGGPKLWVLDWTDYPQMVDQFDQSPVTFHWWLQQSDDARHHFNMPKTAVARALAEFRDMVGERNVWGNGSTFDNVILHHAMRTFGHEQWSFRRDMCYRTIRNLAHNVHQPCLEILLVLGHGCLATTSCWQMR